MNITGNGFRSLSLLLSLVVWWGFAPILGSALGWCGTRLPRAREPETPLKVTVRTYNYAQVPGDILLEAEQHAAEIFRRAGIDLAYAECPLSPGEVDKFPACTPSTGSPTATLKILPESMAEGFGLPLKNFGVTLQNHASFVFYKRVQLANRVGLSEPVVLGLIIAHELGHLLLGEGGHSDKGIMMEDLRVIHFRQAEKGCATDFQYGAGPTHASPAAGRGCRCTIGTRRNTWPQALAIASVRPAMRSWLPPKASNDSTSRRSSSSSRQASARKAARSPGSRSRAEWNTSSIWLRRSGVVDSSGCLSQPYPFLHRPATVATLTERSSHWPSGLGVPSGRRKSSPRLGERNEGACGAFGSSHYRPIDPS